MCTYSGKVFGLSTQSTVLTVLGSGNHNSNRETVESPTRTDLDKARSPEMQFSAPRSQEVVPRNVTESMLEIKEMVR